MQTHVEVTVELRHELLSVAVGDLWTALTIATDEKRWKALSR